jgi:hypothetical protein
MRSSDLNRYALGVGAAAALLAGCGESQTPIGAPGAMPQGRAIAMHADRSGSWMLPEAKTEDLIYLSGCCGGIDIYSYSGKLVGTLTGLYAAAGLCSDIHGNVWVTDGGSVLEYAHGGTIPIAQVYTPSTASGCSVDPTTGDLAVADYSYSSQGQGSLAVYRKAEGTPKVYTDPDFNVYRYCGYDDHGNVYVTGSLGGKSPGQLAELPEGGTGLETITLNEKLDRTGAVQWGGQDLAVADDYADVVYQVAVSGNRGTVLGTTHLNHWRYHEIIQFWIQDSTIMLPLNGKVLAFYKYPRGGRATHAFLLPGDFFGVTVSVPPSS